MAELIAIVLWVVGVVLGVAWLILPLVIISKLRKLLDAIDRSNVLLNVIANHTQKSAPFDAVGDSDR